MKEDCQLLCKIFKEYIEIELRMKQNSHKYQLQVDKIIGLFIYMPIHVIWKKLLA